MATSGTYAFNPALGDIVLNAYARIGLRRSALTAEHLKDAADEANYLLVQWSNLQPLLWTSELQSIPLIESTATYTLDPEVVMVLLAYIETGTSPDTQDRVMTPISTVEYASIPNKESEGVPTTFWLNRLATPTITLWQVPDATSTYTLKLRTVRQVQDATAASGVKIETPYRMLDAFAAGLAHRLARIHAPALEAARSADADKAWTIAATQDVENVPLYIVPGLSTYYR